MTAFTVLHLSNGALRIHVDADHAKRFIEEIELSAKRLQDDIADAEKNPFNAPDPETLDDARAGYALLHELETLLMTR